MPFTACYHERFVSKDAMTFVIQRHPFTHFVKYIEQNMTNLFATYRIFEVEQ